MEITKKEIKKIMPAPNIYVNPSDCKSLIRTLNWVKTACSPDESQIEFLNRILKTLSDHEYYNLTPPFLREKKLSID